MPLRLPQIEQSKHTRQCMLLDMVLNMVSTGQCTYSYTSAFLLLRIESTMSMRDHLAPQMPQAVGVRVAHVAIQGDRTNG